MAFIDMERLQKLEARAKWFWAERMGYLIAIAAAFLLGRVHIPF